MSGTGQARPAGFETLAIHAGQEPDPATGAVVPPIYQVSTYAQDGVGGLRAGYEYSRTANPTRAALEECLAALEGGARALAFASGMAAEDCLLRTVCRPGDHVLIPHDAYGGTYRLFDKVLAPWQVSYQPVPMSDPQAVKHALAAAAGAGGLGGDPHQPAAVRRGHHAPWRRSAPTRARCSWWTTPSPPPTCRTRWRSVPTWWSTRPPSTSAAIPTCSAARWWWPIPRLASGWRSRRTRPVRSRGPFDAWLTLRGIKTLAVRMDRHSLNAARVADMLLAHPAVSVVLYPGLPAHPGHEIAAKQMRGFGGMVSFRVRDGEEAAVAVCGRTRLFILGESLGGVESLIEHPGRMTHASVAGSPLEVPGDLIRLSVGIESPDDLLEDLRSALA